MVEQVAAKFSSLTTLDIRGCDEITARGLESIGRNRQMLASLTYILNPGLEEGALVISRTMPKLKYLRIAHYCIDINPSDVLAILSGCPELETLDLPGCWSDLLDGQFLEENYPKVITLTWPDLELDSDWGLSDGWRDYSADESIESYDGDESIESYDGDEYVESYDGYYYDYGNYDFVLTKK